MSSLSTSFPELFVGITSAIAGSPQLALGVALGSNIVNVTLVIGVVAAVGGGLAVVKDFVKKDTIKAFAAACLPLLLLIDGRLSKIDGLVLLATFALYHLTTINGRMSVNSNAEVSPLSRFGLWIKGFRKKYQRRQQSWFLLGAIVLLFSADVIVKTGMEIANILNIPIILVGLFMVAVGTSLPELALEIRAIKSKQVNIVLGNLLGSVVANSTLILGVVSLISPIVINESMLYVNSVLVFLLGFFLFWVFIKTKLFLSRWEGIVLIGLYILFVVLGFGSI
jgi:cation:H+ antiporter